MNIRFEEHYISKDGLDYCIEHAGDLSQYTKDDFVSLHYNNEEAIVFCDECGELIV